MQSRKRGDTEVTTQREHDATEKRNHKNKTCWERTGNEEIYPPGTQGNTQNCLQWNYFKVRDAWECTLGNARGKETRGVYERK